MAKANFRYFHVWDWPLRVLHWTWVLCIIGLSATGICIAEGWFLKMGDLHGAFNSERSASCITRWGGFWWW